MSFTEDLTEFFDTIDGFAVTALWKGTTQIDGILDDDYLEDRAGFGVGVSASRPVFVVRSASVPGVAAGQTLVVPVGGVSYQVAVIEPDGKGLTRLVLEKQ